MIPKILHYCWFGGGEKPRIFKKCLESWKKYMPDWQIVEWNEENTDLFDCRFLKNAYNSKKWAFVSDVVRLQVIYNYGGVYLDTDVELYSSIEKITDYDFFCFFQNHNQVNTGLGFGAKKGNDLVKKMLDDYMGIEFSLNNLNILSCPVRNTEVIKKEVPEFLANNTTQVLGRNLIVSFDEYCVMAHHYGEFSWKNEEQLLALKYSKKKHKFWKIRKVLRNPKIFEFLGKYNLNKINKIYSFCVYDLIDYGLVYWIKRLFQKVKGN